MNCLLSFTSKSIYFPRLIGVYSSFSRAAFLGENWLGLGVACASVFILVGGCSEEFEEWAREVLESGCGGWGLAFEDIACMTFWRRNCLPSLSRYSATRST